MAEIDPRLNAILSDENRLQQVLDLAQMLRRNGSTAETATAQQAQAPPPPTAQPLSTADLLAALAGASATQGKHDVPPQAPEAAQAPQEGMLGSGNLSALLETLPQLLQAFSGSANVLPEDKVNLVQAIRPYASNHADSFDRAIRMANIAKAAKSAMNTLGNRQT